MIKKNESSIKNVLWNSGIYSVTNILQSGISFLLLPLYTLYLTPENYGITGIVNSFTSILTLLCTLSLGSAINRFYHVYSNDNEKLKSFNGTIVVFVLINSIIMSCIIIIFQDWIISPFIEGVAFYPYILIGILTVVFSPIYNIYQGLIQTMQDGKAYGINRLLHFGLSVILNIVLIVIFKWGAVGQLLSYLFVAIGFGLYSLISLRKNNIIHFNFNFSYLKEALKYSLPLLPHLMSTNIAVFISQLFLNNQVSTSSAGLFNVASKFMLIVSIIHTSVNSAYIPWFYREMDKGKDGHTQIIKLADFVSKLYLVVSVLMSFMIKEVIQILFPSEYLIAWTIIPIMLIAYQFVSIYLFHVNILFYNIKATKYIFIASLSGSLANIIVSVTLTSKLGLITPAIAILAQWIISSTIVIILSKIIQPVRFKLKKMLMYILLMVVAIGIGQLYDLINPTAEIVVFNILYKLIIFILFFFLVLYKELPTIKEQFQILFKEYINKS